MSSNMEESGPATPVWTSSPSASPPGSPTSDVSSLAGDREDRYILVTGGLGFIGSHTSLELLKAGYNVLIVDDLSNSFSNVFDRVNLLAERHYQAVGGRCPTSKLHSINYHDMAAMRSLLESYQITPLWGPQRSRIAGVIHFAAFKAVGESIQQPLKYYRNNISGLVELLSLLDDFGIRKFIFSSSATIYGTIADRGKPLREQHVRHWLDEVPSDEEGEVEEMFPRLTNPYGRTKFFGEAILADLALSDPNWNIVALRYFNPIGCDPSGLLGEDPKGIPSNLLPVVVKVMTGQFNELAVFGDDWETPDGTAVRDFIHVTDLARGHIAAMAAAQDNKLRQNFRTFNLGSGAGNSVTDVVTTMEAIAHKPIASKKVGRRAGDVGSCVAVADRSCSELGWKTERTLKDACTDICNFLEVSKSK